MGGPGSGRHPLPPREGDPSDFMPRSCLVEVVGKFMPEGTHFSEHEHKAVVRLAQAAAVLGLSIRRSDPISGRRMESVPRITMREVLMILDKEIPTPVEKIYELYLGDMIPTQINEMQARHRATVAINRFVQRRCVKKVYSREGKLELLALKKPLMPVIDLALQRDPSTIDPHDHGLYPELFFKTIQEELEDERQNHNRDLVTQHETRRRQKNVNNP